MNLIRKINLFKDPIARNLKEPDKSLFGRFVYKTLVKRNKYLELNAVRQCKLTPSDHVLEVGFGPGLGLQYAASFMIDGKVFGVDISRAMTERAADLLFQEIADNKVELYQCSVMDLPFNKSAIDKAFHCNSFYFWPHITAGCAELYRVLKPGGLMVATMNLKSLRASKAAGVMKYGNIDLVAYMQAAEEAGFTDVHLQYLQDGDSKQEYQCIYATAAKTGERDTLKQCSDITS